MTPISIIILRCDDCSLSTIGNLATFSLFTFKSRRTFRWNTFVCVCVGIDLNTHDQSVYLKVKLRVTIASSISMVSQSQCADYLIRTRLVSHSIFFVSSLLLFIHVFFAEILFPLLIHWCDHKRFSREPASLLLCVVSIFASIGVCFVHVRCFRSFSFLFAIVMVLSSFVSNVTHCDLHARPWYLSRWMERN